MTYVVRSTRVGSSGFLRDLQQAVWSVNPNLPLASVRTLDEIHADSIAQTSFALVMLAIAATVALLLGSVGIYAVIAYVAMQRTREIGIRMALGAQTTDVRRLFLRQGLLLTGAGVALGIVVALALTRVMSALLFGVSPTDPATYIVVAASLASVALLATYFQRGAPHASTPSLPCELMSSATFYRCGNPSRGQWRGFQFRMTVIGEVPPPSTAEFITNDWPSRETPRRTRRRWFLHDPHRTVARTACCCG